MIKTYRLVCNVNILKDQPEFYFLIGAMMNISYYLFELKSWLRYQPLIKYIFNIWYYLKGRLWKKWTIIHPRNLGYTYCDKVELIPHLIFESLCRFIEDEDPFNFIDWSSDEEHIIAEKKIKELYTWWNDVYLRWFWNGKFEELIWDVRPKTISMLDKSDDKKYYIYAPKYATIQDENISNALCKVLFTSENRIFEELNNKCKEVIEIRGYLWT